MEIYRLQHKRHPILEAYLGYCQTSMMKLSVKNTLREKCPNTEFFCSAFSCIRTGYGDLMTKNSMTDVRNGT